MAKMRLLLKLECECGKELLTVSDEFGVRYKHGEGGYPRCPQAGKEFIVALPGLIILEAVNGVPIASGTGEFMGLSGGGTEDSRGTFKPFIPGYSEGPVESHAVRGNAPDKKPRRSDGDGEGSRPQQKPRARKSRRQV